MEHGSSRRVRAAALIPILALAVTAGGCAATRLRAEAPAGEVGMASYYSAAFHNGRTASGERYSKYAMTAAHPTLPFGTRVRVTHLGNGRHVIVRINDRGPFTKGRIIDLSYAAARKLGMIREGLANVRIEPL